MIENFDIIGLLVPITLFITIGFVIYVFFTSRTKERLLQIEKGVNSDLFNTSSKDRKYNLLIFGLLFISIGIGVFVGTFLSEMGMDPEVSNPGSIFICGGIGLILGYRYKIKSLKE
tara:strand:- start:1093 stop:1440 length:348 start_codon:yes stop_codon:yes gene_type:complete